MFPAFKKHTPPAVPLLTLEQVHEMIYKLMERVAELEDRLKQNSSNSSKPPFSNVLGGRPPPVRPRKRSGKQRGAQPSHKQGTTASASSAGSASHGDAHTKPHRVHKVFDLPDTVSHSDRHQPVELHYLVERPVSPGHQSDTAST